MTTQLATDAGIFFIVISGAHISTLASGMVQPGCLITKFLCLCPVILGRPSSGHMVCMHPPPLATDLPADVSAGMIFAVDDVARVVWGFYVTLALQSDKLQCLPFPSFVGKR